MSLPFDELLVQARQGNADALLEIARQYEPQVRAVARVRLGAALRPYLDTIDLVQSVHRSLLMGLRQNKFEFTGPEQLIALALTIVRRKAARQWQRAQRQSRPECGHGAGGDAGSGANLPEVILALSDDTPEPTHTVANRDAVERLCRELPASDRQLLELSAMGYRTVEIADMLGQNADILRVKLSRLRAKLRASGVRDDWF
ncbi:RNA polymerase sigma factor [Tuwongella immobilis]|uniref:RNA polymerase sigma-70 ECF-like HTH domain-containing protein n=1 Tax=Tuwongella immobilis TaxID=692036 RepID=A0A6C2YIL9_9BACT|nr:sigma-70 family RNA polymerase sigma factor [Tuwongella immobilis]VIP01370.1 dna-directed rna polymerase subunit sigma24 : RNA polymerase sigma factor, sigma-70 family OS=Isosphaera pallida (strain ATCC 43644 / DSM 9630 / IS1B) GN=Isop_2474 PE=4 SV=1: Sigma70_ECF [Tuwongella immobilis]VTR98203.1 dna-directed rna polymerase subunit sigma24 : RNA polymerase sigma factor, sigma-70 family OS=Isosphaera pallida (strain ATCC 43644 / DSM 9630 / IS1B) GN=Isop_2474 PE=4 SV=1: Sigma70_ECF [Tuwongella im